MNGSPGRCSTRIEPSDRQLSSMGRSAARRRFQARSSAAPSRTRFSALVSPRILRWLSAWNFGSVRKGKRTGRVFHPIGPTGSRFTDAIERRIASYTRSASSLRRGGVPSLYFPAVISPAHPVK